MVLRKFEEKSIGMEWFCWEHLEFFCWKLTSFQGKSKKETQFFPRYGFKPRFPRQCSEGFSPNTSSHFERESIEIIGSGGIYIQYFDVNEGIYL